MTKPTKVGPKAGKIGKQVPIYKDARGHDLVVGTRVAYNYSGMVAIGVIEHITGSEYHIRRETHIGASTQNTLSKVKHQSSLLAINEVEDVEKARRILRQEALADFATANKEFLKKIRDAWDLDDVMMHCEEQFGENWRDNLDS